MKKRGSIKPNTDIAAILSGSDLFDSHIAPFISRKGFVVGLVMGGRLWWSVAAWVLVNPVARSEAIRLKGIKGDDNRLIVDARDYPWSAIGRLNNGLGGYCSGALIGPRVVLTAAHCSWNHKTQRCLPAESLHFVAGYSRGEYLAHGTARTFTTAPGTTAPKFSGNGAGAHDWALVELCTSLWKTVWVTSAWNLSARRK